MYVQAEADIIICTYLCPSYEETPQLEHMYRVSKKYGLSPTLRDGVFLGLKKIQRTLVT